MEDQHKTALDRCGPGQRAAIQTIWEDTDAPYQWAREEATNQLFGILLWVGEEEGPELHEELGFLRDLARKKQRG